MSIAVVIYSRHLSAEEDYVWFWRECALDRPKCVCSRESFVIQLHLQKKWVQGFLNESLQIAFYNNVLISKFHDETCFTRKRGAESSELFLI